MTTSVAWDASVYQHVKATVSGGIFTIANPSPAHVVDAEYMVYVSYSTTHSIAWGSQYKGLTGVTPTATAGKADVFFFRSNGTNLECVGYRLDIGS